jgi:hypothetical protein
MKKLLLPLLFAAAVFSVTSCKKETTDNSFVTFKKEGSSITWASYAKGEIGPDGFDSSMINLGITGQSPDGKERFDLTIQKPGTQFSTGTYDTDSAYVIIDYINDFNTLTPKIYRIGSNSTFTDHSRFQINITSITPTRIEGNFSGNFLVDDNGQQVAVTAGEFSVQRIH